MVITLLLSCILLVFNSNSLANVKDLNRNLRPKQSNRNTICMVNEEQPLAKTTTQKSTPVNPVEESGETKQLKSQPQPASSNDSARAPNYFQLSDAQLRAIQLSEAQIAANQLLEAQLTPSQLAILAQKSVSATELTLCKKESNHPKTPALYYDSDKNLVIPIQTIRKARLCTNKILSVTCVILLMIASYTVGVHFGVPLPTTMSFPTRVPTYHSTALAKDSQYRVSGQQGVNKTCLQIQEETIFCGVSSTTCFNKKCYSTVTFCLNKAEEECKPHRVKSQQDLAKALVEHTNQAIVS